MRVVLSIVFLFVIAGLPLRAMSAETILVVGDSLSAAYGIDQQQGWVALLNQRFRREGLPYHAVNASITGDTTRGGLARLPAALKREKPVIVVIALGGNDGLRGFAPEQTKANLEKMIAISRASGAEVLLLGVKIPENYGRTFAEKFHRVYLELAAETDTPTVPFFLEGVAETRAMMQPDGIHPAAEAQPRMLENVWTGLEPLLEKPLQRQAAN